MTEEQTELVGTEVARVEGGAVERVEGAREVMDLIQTALADDVSVEKLERLMALKERYDAKAAKAAYLDALAEFQTACPVIPKKKGVSFDSGPGANVAYHYAPLEDITRIIDPILREHGLSYSWTTEGTEGGALNVVCIIRHAAGHEERIPFPVPTQTKAKMSAAQANGAALTYGRRQSLIAGLALTTADEDVDGIDVDGEIETITEQQAADIEALIDEIGTPGTKGKLLRWVGVNAVGEIPVPFHEDVVKMLEEKRAKVAS